MIDWLIGACVVIFVALVAGVIAIVIVATGGSGCPAGQQAVQTGLIPILVGKVIVPTPTYTCEAS